MSLNFPNNPQPDDQYTGDNGVTYIFDGVKWVGHSPTLAPGSNSISNNGYVVQVDGSGNLVIPVGSTIKDADGTPVGGGTISGTGWQLTSSTAVLSVSDDGTVTFPYGSLSVSNTMGGTNLIATTSTLFGIVSQGFGGGAALEWIEDYNFSGMAAAVVVNSPFSSTTGSVQILTGVVSGPVTTNIWTFGTDGRTTFPGAEGFQTTFGSVSPVGDVLHSVNNLHLESEQAVIVNSGNQVADLENTYIGAITVVEFMFAEETLTPGYPWGITLPVSHATYNELIQLPPDTFTAQVMITVAAKAASDAYDYWQSASSASAVNISVAGSKVWTFGADGYLQLPDASRITTAPGTTATFQAMNAFAIQTGKFGPLWEFGGDGNLTLPTNGTITYSANPTNWSGTPPTTIQEAIDRLAEAFKILNNGTGA